MITGWQLYWLTRMDSLRNIFSMGALGCLVSLILIGIIGAEVNGPNKFPWKLFHRVIATGAFLFSIGCFIPTTKEMAAIVIIPKIVNAVSANEQIKKMPDNLLSLANEWIEELKPDKK